MALLCKYRGANRAPDVRFSRPLHSAAALFASKWWTIGFVVAFVAWGLHVAALTMAPLSLVQAVIAGGIALLAIPARHMFGISLGWRELLGLALSAVGLAFLALTAVDHPDGRLRVLADHDGRLSRWRDRDRHGAALLGARGEGRRHGGLMLGASAGLLIGVSDVAIKALAEVVPGSPAAILSPWTLVAAIAAIGAFYALARSLQLGDPVEVIVVSSVAANCAAIVGGVLVFGDPVGSDALGVIARSAAFAAVIAAAALIPAPRPAATPEHA